ncbi:UDP-glucose/GDP-mannose dehydrogenase family protein [bacterium]|nr:UDP-glucose/GDP-mannose dehydrogenase family protein [bacterium]
MRVSIFGMGYVGLVTAACLYRNGHTIVGVDIDPTKIEMLREGKSPIVEPGLPELLKAGVEAGKITATSVAAEAIAETDVSLICVGTPSRSDGAQNLSFVHRVSRQIGESIAEKDTEHTVVLRSTVTPGTTLVVRDIIDEVAGEGKTHFAFNPEFLREGSSIKDFDNPPYTVIGALDEVADRNLREIYSGVSGPVITTAPTVAEMIKMTANAWHATKITFANEVGRLAQLAGVDGREVMNIIMQDTKLNVSTAYMRPGFAYGGSCLPKDVRALSFLGRMENVPVPLLDSLERSNHSHIGHALNLIQKTGKKKIGMLGLAFKSNTDDLRESPAVELAERLLGKGYELLIHDPAVQEAKLMGANKAYIESMLPHLSGLLVENAQQVVEHADVMLVTHGDKSFSAILDKLPESVIIVDVAGYLNNKPEGRSYVGIAW